MLEIGYGGAALAGLLSFLSPCILPMVPFYLCYMAGISMHELRAGGAAASGARGRLVLSAAAFALGVTTIFVLLGLGATALGRAFIAWKDVLRWAAAGFLLLFGLHFLGLLRIGLLYREWRAPGPAPGPAVSTGPAAAYAMGLAFGFGWTPCVGPALAAVLMVAAAMDEIWRGGALLLVYGLAMTLPFVLAALMVGPFLGWAARHRHRLAHVEKVMGAFLILFAALIATDRVADIADFLLGTSDWSATLK